MTVVMIKCHSYYWHRSIHRTSAKGEAADRWGACRGASEPGEGQGWAHDGENQNITWHFLQAI